MARVKANTSKPTADGEGRKPKHREVFDTLLSEIASGRFRPGDRMPTEAELAKTFSASRTTIARAMNDLKARGLLLRQRGGGTRIAHKENVRRIAFFLPMATDAAHLDFFATQFHVQMADLVSRQADDLRLQFISGAGENLLGQMLASVDEMIDKGVRGVLYYPIESPVERAHEFNRLVLDKLRSAALVTLLVERDILPFPQRSDFPVVTFDNWKAGHSLTAYLLQQGRRRIAFFASPRPSNAIVHRLRGYAEAIEDANQQSGTELFQSIHHAEMTAENCREVVKQTRPDAIICESDQDAAKVARYVAAMGHHVGEEIALAGFGDEPIAEALGVPLTTIRFPMASMVTVCYQRLMKQLANPEFPDKGVTSIDVELVIRASSGSPRG